MRRIGLGGVGFEELELMVKNIDTQCWNGMRVSCCVSEAIETERLSQNNFKGVTKFKVFLKNESLY